MQQGLDDDLYHRVAEYSEIGAFSKEEKLAAEAGLMDKSLTKKEVEKHLRGFGIEPEQASHTLLGSLSGGQLLRSQLSH